MGNILSGLVLVNGTDIWTEYGVFLVEDRRGGMENLTAEEDSDAAETYYPTEEEMLARTELAPEIVDAVASEENDEIGPYQMEEYHPRYGYRFGYRRSYYAGPAWEETSTSDQSPTAAAVPTPAAETESAQPEPQPGE